MSDTESTLSRFTSIERLVLLRIRSADGALRAVLPNLGPGRDALRVLHGVQNRDGGIGREEAENGLQALKEIRTLNPNAQVTMVTAMGQQAIVIDALKSGAQDFVVKPFDPDRVLDAVKKMVG